MQPLKSLTFVRIGSANSHKYVISKKLYKALRTLVNKINNSWSSLKITWNVLDWKQNKYDEHWTYSKNIEYFKGEIASQELIDFKDKQEELILKWIDDNVEMYTKFLDLYKYYGFSLTSYHSPPQERGLYAFPQYRVEPFLSHWDKSKLIYNSNNEEIRPKVKSFITIKYNKPTLWCHFIEEARELKVDIKVSKYWVLVKSSDYLKVLALWEKNRVKEHRNSIHVEGYPPIKHCYTYGNKDDLEVFLVGV